MTLSRDLDSYYIKQYSTKSINCTYLLSYFYLPAFLIYQTLSIHYWKLILFHRIIKKHISRHFIC